MSAMKQCFPAHSSTLIFTRSPPLYQFYYKATDLNHHTAVRVNISQYPLKSSASIVSVCKDLGDKFQTHVRSYLTTRVHNVVMS